MARPGRWGNVKRLAKATCTASTLIGQFETARASYTLHAINLGVERIFRQSSGGQPGK